MSYYNIINYDNPIPTTNPNPNPNILHEVSKYLEYIKSDNNQRETKRVNKNQIHLESIPEDKKLNRFENKGLTDNINNDKETKDKARKGLLLLLNKMSNNNFCPEIKDLFEEMKIDKRDNYNNKKEQLNNKNFTRQNLIAKPNKTVTMNTNKESHSNSLKDEDIFKIKFTNSSNGITLLNKNVDNNIDNQIKLTFNKKNKKKKYDKERTRLNEEIIKRKKVYKNDILESEFIYFYDEEVEKMNYYNFKSNNKKQLLNLNNDGVVIEKKKKRRKTEEAFTTSWKRNDSTSKSNMINKNFVISEKINSELPKNNNGKNSYQRSSIKAPVNLDLIKINNYGVMNESSSDNK